MHGDNIIMVAERNSMCSSGSYVNNQGSIHVYETKDAGATSNKTQTIWASDACTCTEDDCSDITEQDACNGNQHCVWSSGSGQCTAYTFVLWTDGDCAGD